MARLCKYIALPLIMAMVLVAVGFAAQPKGASAAVIAHYIDCAGSDNNSGNSPAAAWRTLAKGNAAALAPGDQLLLARGCNWKNQRLDATWTGTASKPITIGAYGTGALPLIMNGTHEDVKIAGSWQIIDHLAVTMTPTKFTACGEPVGLHDGFVVQSGHDNTIQYSEASRERTGIHLAAGSTNSHVLHNLLHDNNMVDAFHSDPSTDLGAWGVHSDGDNNEIGYNTFQNNRAVCSNQGYKLQSNSVELFTAVNNSIHHNISTGDRQFSELGSSPTKKSDGNVYAYNVFSNSLDSSHFITTRGAQDTSFGPVRNTTVLHNSVFLTGPNSGAVSCGLGCSPSVLTTDSNVFWVNGQVLYADNNYTMKNDVYWATNGDPKFNVPSLDPSTRIANPKFTNSSAENFRLQPSSPAINHGSPDKTSWVVDYYGTQLPPPPTVTDSGASESIN